MRLFLEDWVVEALKNLGGEGTIVQVAQQIWLLHENELRRGGDIFYTWQYDMRWAKKRLRDQGLLIIPRRGVWKLNPKGGSR